MAGELEQILSYMDVLDGLDTSGAEPMSHIVPLKNVLLIESVFRCFCRRLGCCHKK